MTAWPPCVIGVMSVGLGDGSLGGSNLVKIGSDILDQLSRRQGCAVRQRELDVAWRSRDLLFRNIQDASRAKGKFFLSLYHLAVNGFSWVRRE
ncbi:MAG: hypothetical protein OXC07_07615 [Kistimonas sp.]|nr:hypothetical protein [Kistimonas sp.]